MKFQPFQGMSQLILWGGGIVGKNKNKIEKINYENEPFFQNDQQKVIIMNGITALLYEDIVCQQKLLTIPAGVMYSIYIYILYILYWH